MTSRGTRGIRGLLAASCLSPSPVPFTCTPKTFDNPDGTKVIFEIIHGLGHSRTVSENESESASPTKSNSPEQKSKSPEQKSKSPSPARKPAPRASPKGGDTEHVRTGNEFTWQTTDDVFDRAVRVPKSSHESSAASPDRKSEADESLRTGRSELGDDGEPKIKEKVRVENGELIGCEDDDMIHHFVAIAEHLERNVGILFDGIVTDFRVEFGITRKNRIYLLSGTVSTTVNPFVRNVMREIPNGESEFVEFISRELAAPKCNGSKCVTGSRRCHKAEYRVPRLFVLLYRARMRWPQVNEARLYKVIKRRLQTIDADIVKQSCSCCVMCLHMYSAEQKRYYGQKLANKQQKYMSAGEYQDLCPGDMSIQAQRDVTMVSEPCSYLINLEKSPYKGKLIEPRAPPPPPARTPQPQIPKSEKWVDRLTSTASPPSRAAKEGEVSDTETLLHEPLPYLEHYEPSKHGFDEKPALRSYRKQPFQYAFIDRMHRRAARYVKRIQNKRNQMLSPVK